MSTKTLSVDARAVRIALLSQRFAIVWAMITALYIFGWATRWTFDPTTTSAVLQNSFFTEQARSILHGHLWVDQQSHPWECFFVDQKCYGYFGIIPSLIRIPLVILGGSQMQENAAFFIAVASGIATWAGVDLCRRVLESAGGVRSTWAPWSMASAAMLLGPAGLLVLIIDPYVYQESLAWSAAGTLIAANYVHRWWQIRTPRHLVVATGALVVASGARPTAAFAGTVIAMGLWWFARKNNKIDSHTRNRLLALALLPIVTTFGVMMLKFGTPLPPFDSYESRATRDFQYLMTINPGLKNGVENIPTSLFAYVRPDAIRFESSFPFVSFRFGNPLWQAGFERITYLPPLPKDYFYVERTTSLFVLTPLALAATLGAFVIALRKQRQQQKFHLVLLVSMAVQPAIMMMTYAVSLRYLVDFYPLFAVSIAIILPRATQLSTLSIRTRRAVLSTVIILTSWSLWVIPALATQDARIYLNGIISR